MTYPKFCNDMRWCLPLVLMHGLQKSFHDYNDHHLGPNDTLEIKHCGLFGLKTSELPTKV